jgi:fibrillarin-like pre-rRNA processing protein
MALVPTPLPNTFAMEARTLRIFTKNLTPGKAFFENESPWFEGSTEYREIDPKHSKLAAALARGCQQFGIKEGSTILYLGASHGYTPSFVSDMVGKNGIVYCLDVAPRVVRDLVFVCEERSNMIPILANASRPQEYAWRVTLADVVFQDIAQRAQLDIFLKNLVLLKPGGFGMLVVKARSIDVTRYPKDIFKDVRRQLEATAGITIVDYRELDPFERDHAFFVVKRKA